MPDHATNPGPTPAVPAPVEPFPVGSRILHIGPPKTGTSALQASCLQARPLLLQQGVRYIGGADPARAVTGLRTIGGNREVPSIRWWKALVHEMEHASEPRVLYSAEALAEASEDAIQRIAIDVGPTIHVLVTLRPIDVVLASQWQQIIQHGSDMSLEDWLRRILGDVGTAPADPLPLRVFQFGDLVDRWAREVGPEHLTVVVLERSDPGFLFRTAEALLALRPGTLSAEDEHVNRSLSLPEIEVIRRMNRQAREAGISNNARAILVGGGAAAAAKRRPAATGAPKVRLPAWAAARAAEMGSAAAAAIGASGVRVLGDLETLIPASAPASDGGAGVAEAEGIDPETAAAMALGVAWGTGLRLGSSQPVGPNRLALTFVPTRELARQIVRRGRARFGRWRKLARFRGG